jgi:hypothetical protein
MITARDWEYSVYPLLEPGISSSSSSSLGDFFEEPHYVKDSADSITCIRNLL